MWPATQTGAIFNRLVWMRRIENESPVNLSDAERNCRALSGQEWCLTS